MWIAINRCLILFCNSFADSSNALHNTQTQICSSDLITDRIRSDGHHSWHQMSRDRSDPTLVVCYGLQWMGNGSPMPRRWLTPGKCCGSGSHGSRGAPLAIHKANIIRAFHAFYRNVFSFSQFIIIYFVSESHIPVPPSGCPPINTSRPVIASI